MANIAGHSFDPLTDRCTLTLADGRTCGRRWLEIHDADASCINAVGFAHVGGLNATELAEIQRERERRSAVFDAAITGRGLPVADPVEWVEF